MRILFVHPAVNMSIMDVSRGYRNALIRAGHNVHDYSLGSRIAYHMKALPAEVADNMQVLSRAASECILNEALYHNADHVVIASGLNLHPIAIWLLGKVGIRVSIIFTESPYEDEAQAAWINLDHVEGNVDITPFTNDRYSAMKYGWAFLAPAFDPSLHKPMGSSLDLECDVLMVGTGWPERQAFLESVDWTGIKLRLCGVWLDIHPHSPLHQFYRPGVVSNNQIASMYSNAKICINFNRKSATALTPGPRCYEIAACGAFQLSDPRSDLLGLFGGSVPTFNNPVELGDKIRYFLANDNERRELAEESLVRVQGNTFDNRAATLMSVIQGA